MAAAGSAALGVRGTGWGWGGGVLEGTILRGLLGPNGGKISRDCG